jgi:hypothetical protein
MIGQKMFLIKKWSLGLVRQRKETLFLSVALDPNSQPSSHNYYHHQDLTLSTFVLSNLPCAHRVQSSDRFR